MTLTPVRNPSAFDYRDYYRDEYKRLICNEEGSWYFCSGSEGEPDYGLTTDQINAIELKE